MSKVDDMYKALVKGGKSQKDAAKEAQARTGVSLVSGKPIKRGVTFSAKGKARLRQYG